MVRSSVICEKLTTTPQIMSHATSLQPWTPSALPRNACPPCIAVSVHVPMNRPLNRSRSPTTSPITSPRRPASQWSALPFANMAFTNHSFGPCLWPSWRKWKCSVWSIVTCPSTTTWVLLRCSSKVRSCSSLPVWLLHCLSLFFTLPVKKVMIRSTKAYTIGWTQKQHVHSFMGTPVPWTRSTWWSMHFPLHQALVFGNVQSDCKLVAYSYLLQTPSTTMILPMVNPARFAPITHDRLSLHVVWHFGCSNVRWTGSFPQTQLYKNLDPGGHPCAFKCMLLYVPW